MTQVALVPLTRSHVWVQRNHSVKEGIEGVDGQRQEPVRHRVDVRLPTKLVGDLGFLLDKRKSDPLRLAKRHVAK